MKSQEPPKTDEPERGKEVWFWVGGAGVIAAGLVWYWYLFLHKADSKTGTFAALGDAVGPFASLLTALALFAALESVRLQRRELQLQREELQETREVMREQTEAAKETAKLQARLADAQEKLAAAQEEANTVALKAMQLSARVGHGNAAIRAAEVQAQVLALDGDASSEPFKPLLEVSEEVRDNFRNAAKDVHQLIRKRRTKST